MNDTLTHILQEKKKAIAETADKLATLKAELKELEEASSRTIFSAGSVVIDGKRDSIEVFASAQVQITSGCSMRRLYVHDGGVAYVESGAKVSTIAADTKATVVVDGGRVTKLSARDCTVDVCSGGVVNTMAVSNWLEASSKSMEFSIRDFNTLVKKLYIGEGAKVVVNERASACVETWEPVNANMYVYNDSVISFNSSMPRCLAKWWVKGTRNMAYELAQRYCPEWAKCAPPEWLISASDYLIEHACITAGQEMWVASGGLVRSTTVVGSGATLQIVSGGSAVTTLMRGRMLVMPGGMAFDTVLCADGHMTVYSGGRATDVVVSSGGILVISSGASADTVRVHPQGRVEIHEGGTISSLNPDDGAFVRREA